MTDLDVRPEDERAPEPKPSRGSVLYRLYHGETHFDFVGKRRIGFAISGILILVSLLSLFTRGLNLGIEFEGGVAWEFPAANTSVTETRSTLEHYGISDAQNQTLAAQMVSGSARRQAPRPASPRAASARPSPRTRKSTSAK